jgi:hypothetical protein
MHATASPSARLTLGTIAALPKPDLSRG